MKKDDPYKLSDGPVAIQFSGGRTSGYMLWHILDRYDGNLPDDCHVLFQNTGREMPETLDFVHECQTRWNVPIVWLERAALPEWVKIVNKTCRASKAVGKNAIVPRYVAQNCTGDVLDFGAGKTAIHSAALRDQGFHVTAYDIGKNFNPDFHDPTALKVKYDIVMVSNVLNVMVDDENLHKTLQQISVATGGAAFFNLPKTPRYGAWAGNSSDLKKLISVAKRYFQSVETVAPLLFKATHGTSNYAPEPPAPFKIVSRENASQDGEPFSELIKERKYAPNSMARFCTSELKVNPSKSYMMRQGYRRWSAVVGFRADEPGRVARLNGDDRWDTITPLYHAGVLQSEVQEWWARHPFDLTLNSSFSNCDGCFLKPEKARAFLARYHPDRAEWWASFEKNGMHFMNPKKSRTWSQLIDHAQRQQDWVFEQENDVYCDTGFGGCHD